MKYLIVIIYFLLLTNSTYAKGLYFIVHPSNNDKNFEFKKTKDIIFKKIKKWENGQNIDIFLPDIPDFYSFLEKNIGMDLLKWEIYWGKETLKTGIKPPLLLKSELFIIRTVSKNKRALGVISQKRFNDKLKKSVKVVLKVDI